MNATTYQLTARNGRPIRRATKVTREDGRVVRFSELLSKREAIRQAAELDADVWKWEAKRETER